MNVTDNFPALLLSRPIFNKHATVEHHLLGLSSETEILELAMFG